MKKTIQTANDSLLKKRQQGQNQKTLEGKELLQKLQSKIDNYGIENARNAALLRIHNVDRDTQQMILNLFRMFEILRFQCIQCKREIEHKFNPLSLQYGRKQTVCDDCIKETDILIKEQKLDENMKALEVFEQKHDAWLDIFVKKCNVPSVFIEAKETDMEAEMVSSLKLSQSYFITGDVGVGKTHLAVVLIRKYISYIKPTYYEQKKEYILDINHSDLPVFIEVPELLLRIRASYHKNSDETEMDIVDRYTYAPLLVLDDLGTEKASEFSTLMLYLIINRRCSSELITIITSNLSLFQIQERLSNRISSRIKGMCKIISMTGHDRRFETSSSSVI